MSPDKKERPPKIFLLGIMFRFIKTSSVGKSVVGTTIVLANRTIGSRYTIDRFPLATPSRHNGTITRPDRHDYNRKKIFSTDVTAIVLTF